MDERMRLFLIVLSPASLLAFFAVLGVLFPQRVARTHAIAGEMPGRALLVGLVNFAFFGGITLALFSLGERAGPLVSIPAVLLFALLAAGLSFGLAGMVQLVGQRLAPQASATWRTVWGWLALWLACLLPFVGWFLLLPYVALVGLGAFIMSLFQRGAERLA